MKKYLITLLAISFITFSCSKDKDEPIPELNKITKITCTDVNTSQKIFSMEIRYNQNGEVSTIINEGNETNYYVYGSNTISVHSNTDNFIHTIYSLSGDRIVQITERDLNPYASNAEYDRNIYILNYSGNYWSSTSWRTYWPSNETSTDYNTDFHSDVDNYTWNYGNATLYKHQSIEAMVYEYGDKKQPNNFPFRITNSLRPVLEENFTPLNLLMGNVNTNLIESAYWYKQTDPNTICAEYSFTYNYTGDYVTGMAIEEKIYTASGQRETTNNYQYEFIYNYN